jgi:uncharacterized protein (DUF427 family)
VRVVLGGETIVDSIRAQRVLETSHPPVYYVPREDVAAGALAPAADERRTFCEWKGHADYLDVTGGGRRAARGAWTYLDPAPGFEALRGLVAFYAGPMDACYVDDERVEPQPGRFYGGWITADVVGTREPGAR